MSIASTIKMTAEQFLMLGEDPPGTRLELVEGEIIVSPSPIPEHSTVVIELTTLIHQHVREFDLGEIFQDVDTVLDPFNIRRPDILFFANDRLKFIGEKAMEGPPTLAVEVISPTSATVDRVTKFAQYRKAGVKHYWLVDPAARSLEAFDLKSRRYVAAGRWQGNVIAKASPFPDLAIPLSKLWRRKRA